jgi:hypothetical protein
MPPTDGLEKTRIEMKIGGWEDRLAWHGAGGWTSASGGSRHHPHRDGDLRRSTWRFAGHFILRLHMRI